MITPAPRLLALDLDGTLLDPAGGIPARSAAALAALQARGVRIVLATGRSPWSVRPIAEELDLEGDHVMMQGGLIASALRGTVSWSRPLGAATVLEHLAFAREEGLEPILGHADGYWAERLVPEVLALSWPTYAEGSHMELVRSLDDVAGSGVIRTFLFTSPARHVAVRLAARERFGDRAAMTWGDEFGLELLAPGVNKGTAVARIAARHGLGIEDVGAVGDGRNDLELLGMAGWSAAMDTALPEVRAAARQVVPPNGEEGVLVALLGWFPWLETEIASVPASSTANENASLEQPETSAESAA